MRAASLWPVRSLPPLFLWASAGNVRHFGSASNAPQSLTAALPSSRQLAGLPLLFLWAFEGNVRHFGTLPRASLQPCPLLGKLPKATFRHFGPPSKAFRPLAASLWPVRSFSAAGRPLAASLWPVRSLPPLFLWASEGNVRHFGPASKASRQPAGLLRPLCGLSEACLLSSYGLPKATLGILDRLQKPLGSRQASCGLSVACHGLSEACLLSSYGLPKATLGILARLQTLPRASPQPCPLLGSWQACLFSSYGLPKATLGILARLQTLPRASPQPCPLLGRLPKATFRHFGPPSKAFRPLAASLWPVRSFSAAGRPLAASLWPVRSLPPLFLWASAGNVRHFGPASKASRQPAGLLRPLCGLSEACLLSSYGLPKATLGILDRLQKPLGSRQASCGLSLWPVRSLPPLFLWASEGNVRHFGSASNAPQSLTAALPSNSRQLAGLPLLFLWASEGNVRHFGSASNAPQGLAAALPSSRQASEGDV